MFVLFGYWMLLETMWGGRTLGKAAVGLRVVTIEGAPVRFRHSAIRAMLAVVDFFLPPLGPVAMVVVGLSAVQPATRRHGCGHDRVARAHCRRASTSRLAHHAARRRRDGCRSPIGTYHCRPLRTRAPLLVAGPHVDQSRPQQPLQPTSQAGSPRRWVSRRSLGCTRNGSSTVLGSRISSAPVASSPNADRLQRRSA